MRGAAHSNLMAYTVTTHVMELFSHRTTVLHARTWYESLQPRERFHARIRTRAPAVIRRVPIAATDRVQARTRLLNDGAVHCTRETECGVRSAAARSRKDEGPHQSA